ncbi:ATP-binding protein [Candidatus Neomarinimicrobiota bacterium]
MELFNIAIEIVDLFIYFSLAVTVLSIAPRNPLNIATTAYFLTGFGWLSALLVTHFALMLDPQGSINIIFSPHTWHKYSTLFLALSSLAMLNVVMKYFAYENGIFRAIKYFSLILFVIVTVHPYFDNLIFTGPYRLPDGGIGENVLPLGYGIAVFIFLNYGMAIKLVIQYWKSTEDRLLAIGMMLIAFALVTDIVLNFSFPLLSMTYLASGSLFGYAVYRRQTFNPVKQLNIQLNEEIRARQEAAQKLQDSLQVLSDSQEALAASESQIRRVFMESPAPTSILRVSDAKFVLVNRAFAELINMTEKDLIGSSPDKLGYRIEDLSFDELENISSGQLKVHGMAAVGISPEGHRLDLIITALPLLFEDEPSIIVTTINVTDQKRLEEQLRQGQKLEALGQLAGGVAHDFNNMLAGILGSTELLALTAVDQPEVMESVDRISKAALRSSELVQKMLFFASRGQSTKIHMDMHLLFGNFMTLLESSIDKRIDIEVELAADKSMIIGDPSQLENALLNLGINARDAMPEGGKLTFRSENITVGPLSSVGDLADIEPGEYIVLSIQDSGIGIPKNLQERVFEPFFSTKEQGKGTGLGLAAVYGSIKEHSGELTLKSELGEGTLFTLYLPLAESQEATSAPPESGMFNIRAEGSVLVVDDEEMLRSTIEAMLKEIGFEVLLAENGRQGVEIFTKHKTELKCVIMDIMMPVMNGSEALLHIKQIDSEVKVIMVSGFASVTQDSLIGYGDSVRFIQKPFTFLSLADTLVSLGVASEKV